MCNICDFDAKSRKYRWPTAVETAVAALRSDISPTHEAYIRYARTYRGDEAQHYAKAKAVEQISLLFKHLKAVDTARTTWWTSKSGLRAQLAAEITREEHLAPVKRAGRSEGPEGEVQTARQKYNELQAINHRVSVMVREM